MTAAVKRQTNGGYHDDTSDMALNLNSWLGLMLFVVCCLLFVCVCVCVCMCMLWIYSETKYEHPSDKLFLLRCPNFLRRLFVV